MHAVPVGAAGSVGGPGAQTPFDAPGAPGPKLRTAAPHDVDAAAAVREIGRGCRTWNRRKA